MSPLTAVLLAGVFVLGSAVGYLGNVLAWRATNDVGPQPDDGLRNAEPTPADDRELQPARSVQSALTISRRRLELPLPWLELLTGISFVAVTVRVGWSWELPALLLLATLTVVGSVVDLRHQRLPNGLVLPCLPAGLVLLTVAAWGQHSWPELLRAVLGSVLLFAIFLVLALISPRGMGMGDVKLAAVTGLFLAYYGWNTLLLGTFAAFVIAAIVAIVLLATARARRGSHVPFGPAMLLAAMATIALAGVHGPVLPIL